MSNQEKYFLFSAEIVKLIQSRGHKEKIKMNKESLSFKC